MKEGAPMTTQHTRNTERAKNPERAEELAPIPTKLLLRPEEAASVMGVSRSRIYELMRQGSLPRIHIGRSVRIPTQAVQAWVTLQADAQSREMEA